MRNLLRRRKKMVCHHIWKITDVSLVPPNTYMDDEPYYELTCIKCNKIRTTDQLTLQHLMQLNLAIKEESQCSGCANQRTTTVIT